MSSNLKFIRPFYGEQVVQQMPNGELIFTEPMNKTLDDLLIGLDDVTDKVNQLPSGDLSIRCGDRISGDAHIEFGSRVDG